MHHVRASSHNFDSRSILRSCSLKISNTCAHELSNFKEPFFAISARCTDGSCLNWFAIAKNSPAFLSAPWHGFISRLAFDHLEPSFRVLVCRPLVLDDYRDRNEIFFQLLYHIGFVDLRGSLSYAVFTESHCHDYCPTIKWYIQVDNDTDRRRRGTFCVLCMVL